MKEFTAGSGPDSQSVKKKNKTEIKQSSKSLVPDMFDSIPPTDAQQFELCLACLASTALQAKKCASIAP